MAYSSIAKPTDYFNIILYTGNGSTNALTGVGFQPDWVWIKNRNDTSGGGYGHRWLDAVRGTTKEIYSNNDGAENTVSTGLTSFDSDGFTLGSSPGVNNNASGADSYVAWNWLGANGTASNTDGSTTSTVSANTTTRFSIVKYAGADAVRTVGHGLGAKPDMIIVKRLGSSGRWQVYHSALGATKYLRLDSNAAADTSTARWNDTEPTSSVFTLSTSAHVNESGDYIAYCFAGKQGYSKFGSYTGNGNADGTFVYTGFKPAFMMIKRSSNTDNWYIKDNKRSGTAALQNFGQMNPNQTQHPSANNTSAENKASAFATDILSNGFKIRGTDAGLNESGQTYTYMSFAEKPFVANDSGTAVPVTAR